MIKTDICIVGAGPGGVTAALHLAKKGIPSLLIDKAIFPRDKVCGDALSGKVVNELKRIDAGIIDRFHVYPIQIASWGIHFIAPDQQRLSVPFLYNYNTATDIIPGYVSRRFDFDNFLVEEAKKHPQIELMEGKNIEVYERTSDGIVLSDKKGSFKVSAKLLIAANGAQSYFTRHMAGIPVEPKHYCAGLRAYYRHVSGLSTDNFIELHFIKDILPGYFWIFPLPDGYANVGIGMLSEQISARKINLKKTLQEIIRSHPAVRDRFKNALQMGEIKGYGLPLGSKKRTISGDNYMLVGDAAHLIDPFSGEGISHAMISGRWAAHQAERCLLENNFSAGFMAGYDKAVYNRLGKELQISSKMQKLLDYPWLFNFIVKKATHNQALAQTISSMFMNLEMREQLKKPSFYMKLLFNY